MKHTIQARNLLALLQWRFAERVERFEVDTQAVLQKDEGLGWRAAVLGNLPFVGNQAFLAELGNQIEAGGLQLVQVAQLAVLCKPEAGIHLKKINK